MEFTEEDLKVTAVKLGHLEMENIALRRKVRELEAELAVTQARLESLGNYNGLAVVGDEGA